MIFTIFSKGYKGGSIVFHDGTIKRERSVATTCEDNSATLYTSPTKVDINIFAMMFLFHLLFLFIILNVMNVGVTYAMMVVHPLIRRHHHHPSRQYSYYDRSQRIGTCQLSLLVRKISFHGRNRKSCHSTQIHQQQQQQQQRNNDDDIDRIAIEQPLQLLSEEQVQAQVQVVEGNNNYYVEQEEDDGGLFFLEASRQAARDRQLQLRTAPPSSSSIESGIVDDVYDTEDETKDDSVSDIDPMLANNKTVVVVEEKELKPTEDSESLITGGARDTAVAPTRTENEDLVVRTDDDEILQSPPPSETPADNSSSSEMKDHFIAPSENDTVSGETLDIPTIHIPPPFEKEDDDDTVRLSSDGKVNFEPNTNLEGEVNQENVDMGLLVLTRALLTVKSIVDRRQ